MMDAITFGSLFSGIGGLDLGLERAGMQCKWQVEIDDYATKVLEKHWPDVPRWRDITQVTGDELPAVDLVCGGFPCQDISYAGKGAGLEGKRSGLFYELARIVRVVGPRFVLLENVAALLTRGMGDVLGTLGSLGYDAEWHCIPAAAVGAPHIRDRVFIFAYRAQYGRQQGKPDDSGGVAGSGQGQEHRPGNMGPSWFGTDAHRKGLARWAQRNVSGDEANSERSRMSAERHGGWWAAEPAVCRVANGVLARVHRLRGLGNAVVPQVAEWIGRQIIDRNSRTP